MQLLLVELLTLVIVAALGFVGLSLQFSDYGGAETVLSRGFTTAVYFLVGGFAVGYARPQRWKLTLITALGGLLWLFPAPLAVAGGYTGARVRRGGALEGRPLLTLLWVVNAALLFLLAYLSELLPVHFILLLGGAALLGLINASLSLSLPTFTPVGWGGLVMVIGALNAAVVGVLQATALSPRMSVIDALVAGLFVGLANVIVSLLNSSVTV